MEFQCFEDPRDSKPVLPLPNRDKIGSIHPKQVPWMGGPESQETRGPVEPPGSLANVAAALLGDTGNKWRWGPHRD